MISNASDRELVQHNAGGSSGSRHTQRNLSANMRRLIAAGISDASRKSCHFPGRGADQVAGLRFHYIESGAYTGSEITGTAAQCDIVPNSDDCRFLYGRSGVLQRLVMMRGLFVWAAT